MRQYRCIICNDCSANLVKVYLKRIRYSYHPLPVSFSQTYLEIRMVFSQLGKMVTETTMFGQPEKDATRDKRDVQYKMFSQLGNIYMTQHGIYKRPF